MTNMSTHLLTHGPIAIDALGNKISVGSVVVIAVISKGGELRRGVVTSIETNDYPRLYTTMDTIKIKIPFSKVKRHGPLVGTKFLTLGYSTRNINHNCTISEEGQDQVLFLTNDVVAAFPKLDVTTNNGQVWFQIKQ